MYFLDFPYLPKFGFLLCSVKHVCLPLENLISGDMMAGKILLWRKVLSTEVGRLGGNG